MPRPAFLFTASIMLVVGAAAAGKGKHVVIKINDEEIAMLCRHGLWKMFVLWLVIAGLAPLRADEKPAPPAQGLILEVKPVAEAALAADEDDEEEDDDDDDRVTQEITVEIKQDGKKLTVTQTVEGDYVGEIIENEENKPVKAASFQELKEKFPDVHAAFAQKPANPLAKPGAAQNVSVQVTDNNGDRKVEAQEPGRKVTMRDKQGKEIEITVKQDLEHGTRTERYEAPHLDALREKHPEMAQLYKQYRDGVIGFGGAVNLQVQAVPGRINNAPVPHPAGQGPRKIVGEHNGARVVIKDDNGRNIRISVTKTVDGKEVTQEYEAPDFATLKKQHKEIAAAYEKLAGKGQPQNQFGGGIVVGNAGVPVRIQVQAQPVPIPAQAIPEPVERVPAQDARQQVVKVKRILALAQQQLERVAADPNFAESEEAKKLAAEIGALAKKLEELEEKAKK